VVEPLAIPTERLLLTQPGAEAAARVASFYLENQEHLAPWAPPRPEGFLTPEYWGPRLEADQAALARGRALRLFLFDGQRADGPALGVINFSQFSRGPFQACNLGYDLDRKQQGQGLMTEALRGAIGHVFDSLNMHRIQANYVPTNERSGRLLRRLEFVVEGYARDYLFIGGAWRDHVLTSLTNPDWSSVRAGILP